MTRPTPARDALADALASRPGARFADPATSYEAAARSLPRTRSVAFAVLRAYGEEDGRRRLRADGDDDLDDLAGLTADEAKRAAARFLDAGKTWGAWRRVSELAALGLIEAIELDPDDAERPRRFRPGFTRYALTRPGDSGREQVVYVLAPAGRDYLTAHGGMTR